MKGSILKEKYSWIWLVVLMTILNLLLYWKFIIGKEFFLVSKDMAIQQYSSLVNWLNHIGDGIKGWSFSEGMGNSYDFSGQTFSLNIFLFLLILLLSLLIKLSIHHCFYSIIYKLNNFYTLIFTLYIYGIKKENSRQNMRTV